MMITAHAWLSQALFTDPVTYQQVQLASRDHRPLPPKAGDEEVVDRGTPSVAKPGACPSGDRKTRAS